MAVPDEGLSVAETSNIEWCDATFNPWIGCTKVSPGCDHCYAEKATPSRTLQVAWGVGQPRRRTGAANWKQPVTWNASALSFELEHGHRRRVFCASLADVFDNEVPTEWRDDLFDLIRATPNLDWLILTKRIGNAKAMLPPAWVNGVAPKNVRIGATVVNQEEVDRDLSKLLALRMPNFLSIEPLLGPISLEALKSMPRKPRQFEPIPTKPLLNWVIVGGESGNGARPMHPQWARDLRDQCAQMDIPYLFKQWGEYSTHEVDGVGNVTPGMSMSLKGLMEWRKDLKGFRLPPADAMAGDVFKRFAVLALPVGKKTAGRALDGRLHDGYPAAA